MDPDFIEQNDLWPFCKCVFTPNKSNHLLLWQCDTPFKMSKLNQFQMFVLDLQTDDRILVKMGKDGQQNEAKHLPIVN